MSDTSDRKSIPYPAEAFVQLSDEERAVREAENGVRQFDRAIDYIAEATMPDGRFRLRPSMLMELNKIAVEGLEVTAGAYRSTEMGISKARHRPPSPDKVPALVDEMCDYVNERWGESALHLSAYVMWRLNWIHPFADGNGRTSRIAAFIVLCSRLGYRLPGSKAVPALIAADKAPYYRALEAADDAWSATARVDVSAMDELLQGHLATQLVSVIDDAGIGPTSIDYLASAAVADREEVERHSAPDGTVTLMFSDIANSTALDDQMGDRQWMKLLDVHNGIIRAQVAAAGGFVVKTMGDGFMVAFQEASAAVRCAIEIQRAVVSQNELSDIRIRIGLHVGEMIKEGNDFYGKHVNLAARVASSAAAGEVLVSRLLYEVVEPRREFKFDGGKDVSLKGFAGVYTVYSVAWA